MAFEGPASAELFLAGRLLFGAVLGFMGVNHFLSAGEMSEYAGAKGVPAAGVLVPVTGALLVLGGLGVAVGAYPVLAAGALAVFLVATTPVMHDFWAVPEADQQEEMVNFLKNAALLGGALALLALGTADWPYAVDVAMF